MALWLSLARHHVTQGRSLASVLLGGRQTGSLQEGEASLATGDVKEQRDKQTEVGESFTAAPWQGRKAP